MAYDVDFKMELVVEVLGGRKISEVAEENDIPKGTLSRWKHDFLDGGQNALESKNNSETKSKLKKLKEENERMKKIIGEKEAQIEILQKTVVGLTTSDRVKAVKFFVNRGYSVKKACDILNISRNNYYYQLKPKESSRSFVYLKNLAVAKNGNKVPEQEVINLVKEYTSKYPYYGYRIIDPPPIC